MKNKIDAYASLILMAGSGTRYNENSNKVLTKILNKEIYLYSLNIFKADSLCKKIYLIVNENDYEKLKNNDLLDDDKIEIVIGGGTRLESVQNGLKKAKNSEIKYFIVHDAARPLINNNDLDLIKESLIGSDGVTLYEEVYDTIRYKENKKIVPLKRENILKIVTPQGFSKNAIDVIIKADNKDPKYTDEITILLENNLLVKHIKINHPSPKLTTKDDFDYINYLINKEYGLKPTENYRIGHSFDFHPFEDGESLTVGGVQIPFNKKLKGWSDADVVYHAVAESIIGALNLVDLGTLYPDNDEKYHNIKSSYFLQDVRKRLEELKYIVVNIDAIIYLEKPSLKKYKEQMKENIAKELGIPKLCINIKATTMEGKGIIGIGEGIGSEVVTLLKYYDIHNKN